MVGLVPCLGFGRGRRLCHALAPGRILPHILAHLGSSAWLQAGHSTQSTAAKGRSWNPKWEGQHCAQWDTWGRWDVSYSPSFHEGPSPECPSAPSSHGIPSLEMPVWSVGRGHSAHGRALLLPRAILSWCLQLSPARGWDGTAAAPQGRRELPALQLALWDRQAPSSCAWRENPHSSTGGQGRGRVPLHPREGGGGFLLPPLQEPPGMGSVLRAQGRPPLTGAGQLGASGGRGGGNSGWGGPSCALPAQPEMDGTGPAACCK